MNTLNGEAQDTLGGPQGWVLFLNVVPVKPLSKAVPGEEQMKKKPIVLFSLLLLAIVSWGPPVKVPLSDAKAIADFTFVWW